jgi:putative hydrolase of the HAD superfamily
MPLRAILFDLDDTLLDTTGTHGERTIRIAEHLAANLPGFDADAFVGRAHPGNPEHDWAAGVDHLLEELGLAGTDLGHSSRELGFFQGCLDLVRCLPHAEAVIAELSQRFVLGVVTNAREYRQRSKFDSLPVREYFSEFVTSERAGVEKPAPEIFRLALDEAAVLPEEAAFVGDRLDTDVLGAKAAGLYAIWLDHAGRCPPGVGPAPDASILGFADLPGVLKAMPIRRV